MGQREADEGSVRTGGTEAEERRNAVCLVIASGPRLGSRFDVEEGRTLTIGTDDACDIRLDDASISGAVAEVSNAGRQLVVRRSGGEGALRVDDHDVDEITLRHGQCLEIGETVFKVLVSPDIEGAFVDQVYELVTHDAVTGLFTKRYLLESLDRQISRARRWNTPLTAVVVRLHDLERGGRTASLRCVAASLLREARTDDVIARVDEMTFVLALYRTHPDGAESLCARILESLPPDIPRPQVAVAAMDVTSQNGEALLRVAMDGLEGRSEGSGS